MIAIIGAGPAGLMAAERLAATGRRIVVFDHMPSPGRKLLMAGRGGLNLTHSEPLERFIQRYAGAPPILREAMAAFPPQALVAWANDLGQETFTGSSGRIFPKSLKASPLLRAWLTRLAAAGVEFRMRHRWQGWDDTGALLFADGTAEQVALRPAATLLALGGASWPRLGSDGTWVEILERAGVAVAPLQPANAGVVVAWSEHLRSRFAGAPLKRISVEVCGERQRGEAIITASGLEGGVIYALTPKLRALIARGDRPLLSIDLRPDLSLSDLEQRLGRPRGKQSMANHLRKAAALPPQAAGLLRETNEGRLPPEPAALAKLIKSVPIEVTGIGGLERAISTAGGVQFEAADEHFMVKALPGVFVAGEMLNWEAPTGGYLLQATFALAVAAADGLANFTGGQVKAPLSNAGPLKGLGAG